MKNVFEMDTYVDVDSTISNGVTESAAWLHDDVAVWSVVTGEK